MALKSPLNQLRGRNSCLTFEYAVNVAVNAPATT